MTRATRPLLVGGAAYVLALVVIALWPHHVDSAVDVNRTVIGRFLLDRGYDPADTYRLIEFSSNVALYVPLGIFSMALAPALRWWQACALALALSTAFELLQRLLPGRTASAQDVVANTLGAAIGAGLVVLAALFATVGSEPES